MSARPSHVIDLLGLEREWVLELFAEADRLRAVRGTARAPRPLAGKTAALVFHKPSLRTRVSFTVGMHELGGDAVDLGAVEVSDTGRESVPDVAHVLSGMVDLIVVRTFRHSLVRALAEHATVPVVNGLTKRSHPCQVMADVLTFEEHRGPIKGRTVAWTGDSNNVLASWIHAAPAFDFAINVATPPELAPPPRLLEWAAKAGARLHLTGDPFEAVDGAAAVISDCWVSMGDEEEARHRHNLLQPYQVNKKLMAAAAKDAVFMHCLPAHRGEEVTDEVIDGPQSIVFDEAENRMHAQKGVLAWCLGALPA